MRAQADQSPRYDLARGMLHAEPRTMMFGELTVSEVDELLESETIARLACIADGRPYVVPIQYACEPGGEAVVVHSLEGKKVRAMRQRSNVCLEIDRIQGPLEWRSLVAQGVFEELSGEDAKRALARLIDRLIPGPVPDGVDPFCPPGAEAAAVLFRVRLLSKHGRFAQP